MKMPQSDAAAPAPGTGEDTIPTYWRKCSRPGCHVQNEVPVGDRRAPVICWKCGRAA